MTLSELCLRRPVLAVVMNVLVLVAGAAALATLPVRELPDVDASRVTVSVAYEGAAPDVIDAEITTIVEGAISGISGIRSVASEAERGQSRTVIEFDPSRDIDDAANDVRSEIARVSEDLPDEANEPQVQKNDSESDPIVRLSMTSDRLSAAELTDYADRYVVDQLATIDGVASVEINGERAYAMRVWLDRQAMAARGVTVTDVSDALDNNNVELPAGEIETEARQFQVRTDTRFREPDEFRRLIVRDTDAYPIRLGDIATVERGVEEDDSLYRSDFGTAIGLGVIRQSQSNTVAISDAVRAEVDRIAATLPEGTKLAVANDDAVFIKASIHEVELTLIIAIALVIGVNFLFLASFRATLVPTVAIPISLVGACAGLSLFGFSINILTLFALILAIGLVVDDAIVVLENVQRRIDEGESRLEASVRGSRQVTFAVIATSAVLIAVFVPLSFLSGQVGRLFSEFGLVLGVAIAVSAFVSLSICPVLCARVLKDGGHGRKNGFERLVERTLDGLNGLYRRLLSVALRLPYLVLGIAAFIAASSVALYERLPNELTPPEDRGTFFVRIEAPQGSSLAYTDGITKQFEAILQPLKDDGTITNVLSIVGQYNELRRAFVIARLSDWHEREASQNEIVERLSPRFAAITGAEVRAGSPAGLGLRGSNSPLQISVGGPDFADVTQWANRIGDALRDNPGLRNVEVVTDANQPGYDIKVNRERARDLGIEARAISEALQVLFASNDVTEYTDRGRQYPVILQARDVDRDNPTDVSNVFLRNAAGTLVSLDGLVTVREVASPRALNRYDRLPEVEVAAGLVGDYDLGAAIEAVNAAAADLPAGARVSFKGQSREFLDTSGGVQIVFGFALLIVFLVLAAQFESFVHPAIIMLTVPLGISGALFTILLAGMSLNIYSQVGLILLVGLMAKNGILIVEFANQLRDEGRSVRDAILEGSVIRLRPILMTVIATVLGAVPLMLSTGAGSESRSAIGVVIVGGFSVATLLTLFVTPVLYDLLAPFTRSRTATDAELDGALARPPRPSAAPAE